MTDLKHDMMKVQALVGTSFTATGALVALANGGTMNPEKLQQTLEKTSGEFERAALELRTLCEKHSPGAGGYGKHPAAPYCQVAGYTEIIGYNWLHIKLNTLLPHCRYQAPNWLTDTIRRLMDVYENAGGKLPFFSDQALLVIDEHSDVEGRRVFDQDNKGWKAVCNALKGRVFPDDDQYTLGVALLSTRSQENSCHITVLDRADAQDFFSFHSGEDAGRGYLGRFYPIR